ncbi:MAG: type II toxin-antitoxin system HicA family toxin [Patescibacteria group bacterium]
MKRKDLERHLIREGCLFLREGGRHSIFYNPVLKRTSAVPRHKEVFDLLAKKICRDLGVDAPKK